LGYEELSDEAGSIPTDHPRAASNPPTLRPLTQPAWCRQGLSVMTSSVLRRAGGVSLVGLASSTTWR
jgi:hypothetical protein